MSSRPGAAGSVPGPAPVLVLGAHRSGTSAVTGLLARAAGLRLGDVMPASPANPRGYFESTGVVRAHNRLLDAMDRDWTCPPSWFDPDEVVLDGLAEEVSELASGVTPWGVKDPRLLFLLPVWPRLLDRVRFVGVIRDHEQVVRSMVARDGIDPGIADGIALAHLHRLRRLRDRWAFPIVDFSAEPDQVLDTVADVAHWLGLDFDAATAAEFLEPDLATDRARGALDSADVEHLRGLVDQDWDTDPVDADDLAAFLVSLDGEDDDLDRYSGPRTPGRRKRAWAAVPRELDHVVEYTRNLRIASGVDPAPGHADVAEVRDLQTLYIELRRAEHRPEAVVLPDVTSWLTREDLVGTFELLHEFVDDHGLVVVGIAEADRDTATTMGREPITGDEVVAAARKAGFLLAGRDDDGRLERVRLLARASTDHVLRRVLEQGLLDAHVREPEPSSREAATQPTSESATTSPGTDGSGQTSSTRSSGTTTDDEWRDKYARLRGRRSVRLAVTMADTTRPLVQALRRIRRG